MNKKYIIGIGSAVAIVVIVLAVLNPFGIGGNEIALNGNSTGNSTANNNSDGRPPKDSNWISPGKHFEPAYEQGASVEWEIEVHNGNGHKATFSVDYRHPDHVEEGYARLPSDIRVWIRISETRPILEPYESRAVVIKLNVPITIDIDIPNGKFEFWIGVIDQSQTGNVITELCQRCFITMK